MFSAVLVAAAAILALPAVTGRAVSTHDPALDGVRRRFVGKTVYAYGGVALGCAPRWVAGFRADQGFVVRGVVRDRGVAPLARGTTTAWPSAALTAFDAVRPLRFIVTSPEPTRWHNYGQGTPKGPCPALVLADDQVDQTITTRKPPSLRFRDPPAQFSELHLGESREEVMWRFGYPTERGLVATMQREPVWRYDRVPMDRFDVEFRHDRVVAFHDLSIHLP